MCVSQDDKEPGCGPQKKRFSLTLCFGTYFQITHPCTVKKNYEARVNQPMPVEQENIEEKQIFAVLHFSRKWALCGWFSAKPSQGDLRALGGGGRCQLADLCRHCPGRGSATRRLHIAGWVRSISCLDLTLLPAGALCSPGE